MTPFPSMEDPPPPVVLTQNRPCTPATFRPLRWSLPGFVAAGILFLGGHLPALAQESLSVKNLPASFYDRPGLENMPRINYEDMRVVSVRDHGALGDGITDDKAAFDRAISTLQPEGGIVFVPAGRYYFASAPLPQRHGWTPRVGLKPLANIHFVGEGDPSEILFRHPASDTDTVFYGWHLDGATRLSLRDLRFVVEPLLQMRWAPGTGITSVNLGGKAGDIQIVRVSFEQGRMGVVSWNEGERLWIVDCDVRNTSADSIHVRNGNDVTVAWCRIENSGDDGVALWMATNDNQRVDYSLWGRNYRALHNTVIGTRWGRGIGVSGKNIEVRDNWVEGTVFPGILVMDHDKGEGLPPSEDVLVGNNTVIRAGLVVRPDNNLVGYNTSAGILVAEDTGTTRLVGNRILSGQGEGVGLGYPFPLRNRRIEIAGNEIAGNLGEAIRATPTRDSRIESLDIHDNRLSGNAGGAIRVGMDKIAAMSPPNPGAIHQDNEPVPEDVFARPRRAPDETRWALPAAVNTGGLPQINVRDHGARGDGLHNDLPAFLDAIAAAPADGAVIHVPAGTWRLVPQSGAEDAPGTAIRQHLLIRRSSGPLHFVGDGNDTRIVFSSRSRQGIRFLDTDGGSIQNMTLRYEGEVSGPRNRAALDVSASRDIVLQNLTITHSSGPGILLDSSDRVAVRDSRISACATEGIRLLASRQVEITRCDIRDTTRTGILVFWLGGIAREPQYLKIHDNKIAASEYGAGIGLAGGTEIEVSGNTISDCGLTGIAIYEQARAFNARKVRILDNTISTGAPNPWTYARGAVSIYTIFGGKTLATDYMLRGNQLTNPHGPAIWVSSCKPSRQQNPHAIKSLRITGNHFTAPVGVEIADSLIESLVVTGNAFTSGAGNFVKMTTAQRAGILNAKLQ
ncbi:right-handed parallel beta-helix repeat-containing protein [Geminisphaera colitermitum]|uniref:right-handed parallel beta-helix repeat-containing protein n=1 Tax=Geminisphaera colitermitum TaxID=1148786 RepID=UPI0012FF384F|nr:right-handed parallel beta-helix repeat-containing protein [Geminisphaera colitermitum]